MDRGLGDAPDLDINSLLPNEMLAFIFKFLESKDLFSCHAVSPHWKSILDNCVGIHLHVGNPSLTDPNRRLFRDISAIREYGAVECHISGLQERWGSVPVPLIDHTLTWRAPHLLKYLSIDGHIRPTMFNHLTKDLYLLKSLVIHFSTLDALDSTDLNLGNLTTLEEFTIQLWFGDEILSSRSLFSINIANGIERGVTLLESPAATFPRLHSISFGFPHSPSHMRYLNRAICAFCRRHGPTLRHVKLTYCDFTNTATNFRGDPGEPLTTLAVQGLNLDSLEITIDEVEPEMDIYLTLMNDQRKLKEVSVSTLSNLIHILPTIKNCHQTLTTVDFRVDVGLRHPGAPVNLSSIGTCSNLKSLTLMGFRGGLIPETVDTLAVVSFGGVPLPKSLRRIYIYNIFLATEETLAMLDEKPLLDEITLNSTGSKGNLGINFEVLVQIIKERRVKTILIWKNSVNASSVGAAAKSDDPCTRATALLFTGMTGNLTGGGSLHLILNPGGYYEHSTQQIPENDDSDGSDQSDDDGGMDHHAGENRWARME